MHTAAVDLAFVQEALLRHRARLCEQLMAELAELDAELAAHDTLQPAPPALEPVIETGPDDTLVNVAISIDLPMPAEIVEDDPDPLAAEDVDLGDLEEPSASIEALELKAVERALHRIRHGTYGACESCGGPIEQHRLAAVPWSRCCLACVEFWDGALRSIDDEAECVECAGCSRPSCFATAA